MTTNVLEAASNRHSIKPDISADVAYSIARSQQATEEFKIFAIITTRIVRPLLSLAPSIELQPMALGLTRIATGLACGLAILSVIKSSLLAPLNEDTRGTVTSIP